MSLAPRLRYVFFFLRVFARAWNPCQCCQRPTSAPLKEEGATLSWCLGWCQHVQQKLAGPWQGTLVWQSTMPSVACTTSLTDTRTPVSLRAGGQECQQRPHTTGTCTSVYVCSPPVMAIRFANDDKTRLACASRDGTLSVFNLTSEPPSLVCTLRGHSRAVNGEYCHTHQLLSSRRVIFFLV